MKRHLTPLWPLFFPLFLSAQTILYVDQQVQGGQQNGSSWTDAFTDLQAALAASQPGDTIWVAEGRYLPTNGADRSVSFVLRSGVQLYGGFSGTETDFSQRDYQLHATVLSGDIGSPTGQDNTYHVLRGEGLDSTTVLDGFVIRDGMAKGGAIDGNGGGLLLLPSPERYFSRPVVQNCRFEFNTALYGGAIHSTQNYQYDYLVNPLVRRCAFVSNRAVLDGGAMVVETASLAEQPFLLEDCLFLMNSSFAGEGGGVYMDKSEYNTIIRRCTFEKDSANLSIGGGVYFRSGYEKQAGAILLLDECIFKECVAQEGAGIQFVDGGIHSIGVPPFYGSISNCRFEKNFSSNGFGAGFYFIGYDYVNWNILIKGSTFEENRTVSNLLNVVEADSYSVIHLHVQNCQFTNNYRIGPEKISFALNFGVNDFDGKLDALVENCLFVKNSGGIHTGVSGLGGQVKSVINNCTFYFNEELVLNKSYHPDFDGINDFIDVYVNNCVFWQPIKPVYDIFSDNSAFTQILDGYHVDYSLVSLDSFTIKSLPIFGPNVLGHTFPDFIDPDNGNFRLRPCSPAVNTGDNTVIDSTGLAIDLDGRPRIYRGRVDMGVYETQDSCFVSRTLAANVGALRLSPNPVAAGATFQIETPPVVTGKLYWVLSDMEGKRVSEGTEDWSEAISLHAPAPAGVYVLDLLGNGQTWRAWLVVH